MKIRMSDERRGTSRKIGTEGDAGAWRRRNRRQHLQQTRRCQAADQHQTGRRWRRGGAAQIAVFAGVPWRQTSRLLAGRCRRAGIVQADDGEGIDAALSGRESGADAGQQRMHGDCVDRHPAQHLSRAQSHLRKTPRISRRVSLS